VIASKTLESGCVGELCVTGALPLEDMDELAIALMRMLFSYEHVVLNLEGLTSLDSPCLRVLCSVHRMSENLNKSMTLRGKSLEVLEALVQKGGYCARPCALRSLGTRCFFRGREPRRRDLGGGSATGRASESS
jgi:ABC-type transporter Mla MlaB component